MALTKNIKISIVTPVYNGEAVIKDLLLSVLGQSYSNWEMIIQDGGSKDTTLKIINEFDDKRIKIYSESDNGMYDALNKAIVKTTGDYIIHLNSDEQLLKGALDVIIKQIKIEPNFNVYCFGVVIMDKQRNPKVFRVAYPQKRLFIKLFNLDILTAGIVYEARVFDEVEFSTDFNAVSDAILFIDLVKKFKLYYSNKYSSLFLIEGKNLSLEEIAVEERKAIKSSVLMSSLSYYLLYLPRKILKIFYGCSIYKGPTLIELYFKGKKIDRNTYGISNRISWKL